MSPTCKYCEIPLTNLKPNNIANHVRWCSKNPNRQQKQKKLPEIKICPRCNTEFRLSRKTYCSSFCAHIHSNETKQHLSKMRKKFLLENPDKHHWRTKEKHKSEPCEKVKEYLKSLNINFVEEWQPLSDYAYSLDIAFPDKKLAIEINGNQHYNSDGTLKEYYQNRHDLIEREGWTILELHYTIAYNLEKLLKLIEIKEQPNYSEYFRVKQEKKALKIKTALPLGQTAILKNDRKWESFKEKVLNSGINFSRYGWVQQVSEVLGISPQKVNSWMKRYLPEFYEQHCFKRKVSD